VPRTKCRPALLRNCKTNRARWLVQIYFIHL
jgi:hypothetical protein